MKSEDELFKEARDQLERWAVVTDDEFWRVNTWYPPMPVLLTGIEFEYPAPLESITAAELGLFSTPAAIELGAKRVGFQARLIPGQRLVVVLRKEARIFTRLIFSEDALREWVRAKARKTS